MSEKQKSPISKHAIHIAVCGVMTTMGLSKEGLLKIVTDRFDALLNSPRLQDMLWQVISRRVNTGGRRRPGDPPEVGTEQWFEHIMAKAYREAKAEADAKYSKEVERRVALAVKERLNITVTPVGQPVATGQFSSDPNVAFAGENIRDANRWRALCANVYGFGYYRGEDGGIPTNQKILLGDHNSAAVDSLTKHVDATVANMQRTT